MKTPQATTIVGTDATLDGEAVRRFEARLGGELLRPGDEGYEECRKIWNDMICRPPALIARRVDTADVIAAVNFARENDLLLSIRGGHNNIAGHAVAEGDLTLVLSSMKGIQVDPASRAARAQPGITLDELNRENWKSEYPPGIEQKMVPTESTTPHEEEDTHSPAVEAAVVRILALGPTRVEKDGQPLVSPVLIQKSRELLYYLLSHPEGRTKEQIGLALWPEASTAQLRSSFHDTVYRLRRALGGKERIAYQKGRYTFERSLPYSYDVDAFEENLSEARRVQSEAPEQSIRHLQQAAELYRGDFLEELTIEGEWAMERQEELRQAYGEALLLLGRLLSGQSRHAEAAEAYRKAISHDRFLEEAHRGLMRCQAALGERGRALRHYEELVELLDEQLGSSPAPETSALYGSLLGRFAPGSRQWGVGSRGSRLGAICSPPSLPLEQDRRGEIAQHSLRDPRKHAAIRSPNGPMQSRRHWALSPRSTYYR